MKAVIVDLSKDQAVALQEDGQFVKIKNANYSIGQEICLKAQTIRFTKQAAIAASAALVLLAGGGFGTYTWSNPYSYVSLDINPSIAYSLNEYDRVISATGMNEEGEQIVEALGRSIKNRDITTALSMTIEQLTAEAYIDSENTNYLVIGVYSDDDTKANKLLNTVDSFSPDETQLCSISTVSVSKETKDAADELGISCGKMELINEVASVSADVAGVDPVVLADMSVAELEQAKADALGTDNEDTISVASNTDDTDAVSSDLKSAEESDSVTSTTKDEVSTNNNVSTTKSDTTENSPVTSDSALSTTNPTDNSTPASVSGPNPAPDTPANPSEKPVVTPPDNKPADNEPDNTSEEKPNNSSEKKDQNSSEKKNNSSEKKPDQASDEEEEIEEDASSQTNDRIDLEWFEPIEDESFSEDEYVIS
ncbi:MAG: anti-sigma factor domain-containing protein [bacterium]|nr:anti-sigma factor domain-containing protein [bacterium]